MKAVLVLFALFALVFGHAKLDIPDNAWNTQPSKVSPCGWGPQPTTSNTVWVAGTTVPIVWQIVAADGEGPATLTVDPAGGTNFSGKGTVIVTPTAVITYYFNYTVPLTLVCTGPNQLCTIQVASSSGWFACASVFVQAPTAPPAPTVPASSCQIASNLVFCAQLNGHNVVIPTGVSPSALDGTVSETYYANLYNPLVFSTPNATGCHSSYQQLVCADQFPFCGQTTACQSICNTAVSECGLTVAEKGLYVCNGPISCLDPSGGGGTNPPTHAGASLTTVSVLLLIALFALL